MNDHIQKKKKKNTLKNGKKGRKKEMEAVNQSQLLHSFSLCMETMRRTLKMNEIQDLNTIEHTTAA